MNKQLNTLLKEYGGTLSSLETKVATDFVAAINNLRQQLGDMCLSAAGLAIGSGSAKKIKITNTVAYLIDFVFKSKSTAEIDFTADDHDIAADAEAVQEACYTISLDGSGTATITMGDIASGAGNAVVPAPPDGECMIGYLRLAVALGATPFDATSDDLNAGHLTATYVDMAAEA